MLPHKMQAFSTFIAPSNPELNVEQRIVTVILLMVVIKEHEGSERERERERKEMVEAP